MDKVIAALIISIILMTGQAQAGVIQLPQTGQQTKYATGDDGDLNMGIAWPSPRFTDNNNGTVTDKLTGLIWLKNATCFGYKSWSDALVAANTLASGACGLTDSSSVGQWRLPNRTELESLVAADKNDPALPAGHPFTGVLRDYWYWSSSTFSGYTGYAWFVFMSAGTVYYNYKSGNGYVWPVRQ